MRAEPETIVSIYDAALSQRHWRGALDRCKVAVGADAAMLYQFSDVKDIGFVLEETSSEFVHLTRILIDYNKLISEGNGSNFDEEGMSFVHRTPVHSVTLDKNIWPIDAAYLERPEVKIGIKAGFLRRSIINLSDDPSTSSGMIFLYGRDKDKQIPSAVNRFGPLLSPHVAKASEIYRFTDRLRQAHRAVLSVLDKFPVGVLVVSKNGEIVVCNRACSALLDAQDGISATKGFLRVHDDTAQRAISSCVSEVCLTARGESGHSGTALQVPRRGIETPLVAVVSPLRDAEVELEKNLTGALITFIDPASPVRTQTEFVSAAYGLTKTESNVARMMLEGLSNREIAEHLGVSTETIKSHVSSVLGKSGCRTRVAFVWRVYQLAPPLS